MRKLAMLGLAGALAVAGVGMTAVPSAADHRSGFSVGLSFGTPRYYYDDYPYHRVYRPYRTYRTYRYVAPPRQRVIIQGSGWQAHVAWCYQRYRSYRASDNTFQPYNGPRRECYSPYYG
jgi:hypothetical protein